jgi:hypothetical protein
MTDVDSENYMKNFESNLPNFLVLMQVVNVFVIVVSTVIISQRILELLNYTGWSKSLCAPGDYNTESYK